MHMQAAFSALGSHLMPCSTYLAWRAASQCTAQLLRTAAERRVDHTCLSSASRALVLHRAFGRVGHDLAMSLIVAIRPETVMGGYTRCALAALMRMLCTS